VIDWTTVLVAIGPAGITGLLGYYGAKRTADTAERQANAPLAQITLQRALEDQRQRQEAYHDLVDKLRDFETAEGRVAATTPEIARWRYQFDHVLNGVRLFGAGEVPAAAEHASEVVHAMLTSRDTDRAFLEGRADLQSAHAALVEAMRQDVAPPHRHPQAHVVDLKSPLDHA
jgi:hypothetical protein